MNPRRLGPMHAYLLAMVIANAIPDLPTDARDQAKALGFTDPMRVKGGQTRWEREHEGRTERLYFTDRDQPEWRATINDRFDCLGVGWSAAEALEAAREMAADRIRAGETIDPPYTKATVSGCGIVDARESDDVESFERLFGGEGEP